MKEQQRAAPKLADASQENAPQPPTEGKIALQPMRFMCMRVQVRGAEERRRARAGREHDRGEPVGEEGERGRLLIRL